MAETTPNPSELGPGLTGSADWPKLVAPLISARKAMAPLVKTETAETGKFSYAYADLPALLDVALVPLADNGMAVIQAASCDSKTVTITTVLAHKDGPWLANVFRMPVGQESPQAYGSAETYARRYALLALLALAGEDDDGQAAMPKAEPAQRRTDPPPARGNGKPKQPDNPAAEKIREILREQVKCPRERGDELFDAATCGRFRPAQLSDPEASAEILAVFEKLAESIPYSQWIERIADLRHHGVESEFDEVFGPAEAPAP